MGCRNCLKYNGKACELGLSFPCGEYVPHIINPFDKQGDLISRSALLKRVESVNGIIVAGPFGDGIEFGIDTAKEWIIEAPSVDAVEVVHGRWIPIEEKVWNLDFPVVVDWKCSACNGMGNEDFNYCPNCGAKMDGGNNG